MSKKIRKRSIRGPQARLNVRVPVELYSRVLAKSDADGVSVSDVVRDFLEEWLDG